MVPHKLICPPLMKVPKDAWKRGIEDVVIVQYTIDKSGRIENLVVLDAENGDYFAKTALAMVSDFKYRSGSGGKSSPAVILLPAGTTLYAGVCF